MEKFSTLFLAYIILMTVLVAFDFAVFNLKNGARTAYFTKLTWKTGFVCALLLIYWLVNGMKFI